ncbi:unnamed protein product, partial [marine sediment metagenome]
MTAKYSLTAEREWYGALYIQNTNVKIDGLQIESAGANSNIGIDISVHSEYVDVSNCILRRTGGGTSANAFDIGAAAPPAAIPGAVRLWNNIAYEYNNGVWVSWHAQGIALTIYNNTFVDMAGEGIHIEDQTIRLYIKNNLVFNAARDYYIWNVLNLPVEEYSHNLGEDAAFTPGTGYVQTAQGSGDMFVDYVTPDNKNFCIRDGSDAQDAGADLSGDLQLQFSNDIAGDIRHAPWDIGADEGTFTNDPPYTSGHDPAKGAVDVALDTNISAHI